MKKNKMLRIASGVAMATLLSTCVISGTFAKYVTSANVSDEARVAYWGFTQTGEQTFELFKNVYTNVKGENGAKVIAPGTSNTASFNFAYTDNAKATAPEVAYNFAIDFVASGSYAAMDANVNFTWSLQLPGGSTTTYNTVAELETAIEALNKKYEAGTLPDGFDAGANTITLGWNWAFHTDAAGDADDNAMGNATNLDNVKFVITISATQVD